MEVLNHLRQEIKEGLTTEPREATDNIMSSSENMNAAFDAIKVILETIPTARFQGDRRLPTMTMLAALEEGMDMKRHYD